MADKTLKASIQVDMDAKGVAKGVAATNRELDKLNRTARSGARAAMISAGIDVVQTGMTMIQTAFSAVEKRMGEMAALANKYSPEAMNASIQAELDRYRADARIGQALAPGAMERSRADAESAAGEAARIEANASTINAGMGASKRFGNNLMAALDIVLETGAGLVAMTEARMSGDLKGANELRMGSMDMAGELFNANNYTYSPGTGSARGMPYDEAGMMRRQTEAMEKLSRGAGN
jgi:hypothetical protein